MCIRDSGHRVVSSQGRALRLEHIALHIELKAVLFKVVDRILVFFADNVGVPLHQYRGQVFTAGSTGFLDIDIVHLIHMAPEAVLLGKGLSLIHILSVGFSAAIPAG